MKSDILEFAILAVKHSGWVPGPYHIFATRELADEASEVSINVRDSFPCTVRIQSFATFGGEFRHVTLTFSSVNATLSQRWERTNSGWHCFYADKAFGALPAGKNGNAARKIRPRKADQLLGRLCLFLPRRHREAIMGDLNEDLKSMRQEGTYTEKDLCRYVRVQVFYAAAEVLKPWHWLSGGLVAWAVKKVSGLSWFSRLMR